MSYKAKTGDYRDFFHTQYQLEYLIGKLKVPFVALIDGITMGAVCIVITFSYHFSILFIFRVVDYLCMANFAWLRSVQ